MYGFPLGVGRRDRSRGKLTIARSPVVGSRLATRIVSLRACDRCTSESIPVMRMLIRDALAGSDGAAVSPGARDTDGVGTIRLGSGAPSGSCSPTKISL